MSGRAVVTLFLSLVALLAAGWIAGVLVADVFDPALVDNLDRPLTDRIQDARSPAADDFMLTATRLGAGLVLSVMALGAAAIVYVVTGRLGWSVFILMSGLGGPVLDKVLKPLVGRPRPQIDPLVEIGGNSFPSGHATGITALWLALALFAYLYWGRRARWVWPVAIAVIVLVGLTRPYLGVHWPTDVLAGILLSAGWVLICLRFTRAARQAPGPE